MAKAAKIPLVVDTREQRLSVDGRRCTPKGVARKWINENQGKHSCQCGCGGVIAIQIHHYRRGVPKFIDGHGSRVKNGMKGRFGKLNPNFKNGRYIDDHGYVVILNPEGHDPKYVYEHRQVMSDHLGRDLTSDEVVHHKNRIKTDNRIENLKLTNHVAHGKEHAECGEIGFPRLKKLGKLEEFYASHPRKNRKINFKKAEEIRRRRKLGERLKDLAAEYKISINYCLEISKGRVCLSPKFQ